MIRLFILDVPEFEPVVRAAADCAGGFRAVGDYVEIASESPIVVDRKAAGARPAVWFSAISAVIGGQVTRFDRHEIRIEAT